MRATRGFTLIEIIAATALAALLMMTLLSVATSVQRSERRLRAHDEAGDRHQPLLDLLRHDLAHARRIEQVDNRLILTGYGSLDQQTLVADHAPVRVTYAVVSIDGRGVLVREQMTPRAMSNRASYLEMVAMDVEMFHVQPVDGRDLGQPLQDPNASDADRRDDPWSPLPSAALLTLRWSSDAAGRTTDATMMEVIFLE